MLLLFIITLLYLYIIKLTESYGQIQYKNKNATNQPNK